MRLTTMTDYALRVLIYVAQNPDRLCTIAEIAQRYNISEAHLMKVTHRLSTGGWLETVRGRGGGMRLAGRPQDIHLGEVVRGIEPDFEIVACFGAKTHCALDGGCRLASALDGALGAFHRYLDQYTLKDIMPNGRSSTVLVASIPKPHQTGARS